MTAAALIVMPLLAVAKRRTGRALGNRTLIADSAESALCALTSAAALLGVGLNAWLGWWWADPAAGLAIAALAVREGMEAWEEDRLTMHGPARHAQNSPREPASSANSPPSAAKPALRNAELSGFPV